MRKYNRTNTTFICVVDGKRVYRHDMPHGLIKYSIKQGRNVLQSKVSFAKLGREIQRIVSEEWQKKRMLNVA